MKFKAHEWCNFCNNEVILTKHKQECPKCKVVLLACSQCDAKGCKTCSTAKTNFTPR